jgi:glycosyltransferase involved in cell wall biosynthesis
MSNLSQCTAVICTVNCAETIYNCIMSLRKEGIGKVILVDGKSTDGTRDLVAHLVDEIVTDPREGLAVARNLGISRVTTKYVLNWGADNEAIPGSLTIMHDTLERVSGASAMTVIKPSRKTYLSWALNQYKKLRYFPGRRGVIGTPTLFKTELLKSYGYDPAMGWSDDGDLCTRMSDDGHEFEIAPCNVYEIGDVSFSSIRYRWSGYGRSDYETYSKYAPTWSTNRKLQSLLYPLKHELIVPFLRSNFLVSLGLFPFLVWITVLRYYSWVRWRVRH